MYPLFSVMNYCVKKYLMKQRTYVCLQMDVDHIKI